MRIARTTRTRTSPHWAFLFQRTVPGSIPDDVESALTFRDVVLRSKALEKLADTYSYEPVARSWEPISTTGDAPAGREGHTASILDEKLYVFGGADGFGNLNDVRALDLGTYRWSHPRSSGMPPKFVPVAQLSHRMIQALEALPVRTKGRYVGGGQT